MAASARRAFIGNADNGGLTDRGMLGQDVLDRAGVVVVAVDDDHVLEPADAAYAAHMLVTYLFGAVAAEQAPLSASAAAGQSPRSYLDGLRAHFEELPAREYPNIVALAGELTEPDLTTRFDFALERLLDGIAALAP